MADEDQNQTGQDAPENAPDETPEEPTSLDEKLAAGEAEEQAAKVSYTSAVFTVPEDGYTFENVADDTGLAKQHLDVLVAQNPEFPYGIRTSFLKGDKVDLPRGFSYVDVKNVKGGELVTE